ncbi:MAG: aminotransferase class V-fold PLP-dependent enzyme [Acidimicrobiales bacterium]
MREIMDTGASREGLARVLGQHEPALCVDGVERPYVDLDAAASTPALVEVAEAVNEFLPGYASVHRGAGWRSRSSTAAYEQAREAMLRFASKEHPDDLAVICRNTTEAINHLAFRLDLQPDDVVVTTVIEHHANLLPWRRYATVRYVECTPEGTFEKGAVGQALHMNPRPKLLAVTGASNVSGWLPPIDTIIELAHGAGVPVLVDAAQLAPHRPLPATADYVAWSGHKMYAPFGAGALVAPTATFTVGDPFLAGGGAVDLVSLDEVLWNAPPEREEAGSPNVVGAVAMGGAVRALERIGWPAIRAHDDRLAGRLRDGLAAIPGVRVLGPGPGEPTLPVASFTLEGVHHALVAARLAAEWGIGVRHGCFCAHPYLLRLLGMSSAETAAYRAEVRRGDHMNLPGAIRASASIATGDADIDQLLDAVRLIATGESTPVPYQQDPATGDFHPSSGDPAWSGPMTTGGGCASG